MLACWVEDPSGEYFKKHLARIPDYLWVAEDGMTMQVDFFSSTKVPFSRLYIMAAVLHNILNLLFN